MNSTGKQPKIDYHWIMSKVSA